MQNDFTNICETMDCSKKIKELEHGCKSAHDISSILDIMRSTVSGIIAKWNHWAKEPEDLCFFLISIFHSINKQCITCFH